MTENWNTEEIADWDNSFMSGMPPQSSFTYQSKGKAAWDVLYPLLIFLVCSVLAGTVVSMLSVFKSILSGGLTQPENMLEDIGSASMVASLIAFAAALVICMILHRKDDSRFGKETGRWPVWKILVGVAIVCAAGILGNILLNNSSLDEIFPAYERIAEIAFTDQDPVLMLVTTGIIGPAAEEFCFRGLIQRRACQFMKPWQGVLLAAVLFGLYHMNMIQLLYALPLGLLMGWLYQKSGRIWTSVIAHMAANIVVLAVF